MNHNQKDRPGKPSGGRHIKPTIKKKSHAGRYILIVVLAILLALGVGGYLVFRSLYNKMGTNSHANPNAYATAAAADSTPDATTEPTPTPTPEPLTEEELAALEEQKLRTELQETAEEIIYSDDVYNLLLIGSDGRTEELERSDAMILLSINSRTKEIWLTSMMRDTEVTIPNWGTGHLNWATRFGGVEMLIDTLSDEHNFAIQIDNWAMVDFVDFIEVADMLTSTGGITVTVDSLAAAEDMNLNIREACQVYDAVYGYEQGSAESYPRCYFTEADVGVPVTITNGAQILGYARERHYGGDTGRSEKQRDVLMQFWSNIQKMSLKEQYALAEKVLSVVQTDLSMGKCASLLLKAPQLITYDIYAQQCPTPGGFWKGLDANGLSIYNCDFVTTRNFLRATIYGEELTAAELTSYWTGEAVLLYDPES